MKSISLHGHSLNKGKVVGAVLLVYKKEVGILNAENQKTSKSN